MSRRLQSGFTLIEVMISMAILFGALVMMLSRVTADVRATNRAKLLTAANGLARAKMLDLEEELLFKGFQETAAEMEGDFSDEGFPRYTWKATIEKVELPAMQQLQQAQAKGATTTAGEGSMDLGADPSGGAPMVGSNLAMMLGGVDPAMIGMFSEAIVKVLEDGIRKVTLTVSWKAGNENETLTVAAFYTDPKAVDQGLGAILQNMPESGGGGGGGGTNPPPRNPDRPKP